MRIKLLLAGILAALAVGASQTPAPANAEVNAKCAVGYVCVQPDFRAPVILIPEGERRQFPGGVRMTSVTNFTRLGYCVIGEPSFALLPGWTVNRSQLIDTVAPADTGTVCPA